MNVQDNYQQRIHDIRQQLTLLKRKKSYFAWARLLNIALIILTWYLFPVLNVYTVSITVLLLIVFVRLIYADLSNRSAIGHHERLLLINEDEIKALNGEFYQFANGTAYLPKEHPYAADMDILGHASLFQFMNRTVSEPGAGKLADWLLNAADPSTILNRQEAVKELKDKMAFRQNLQAYGKEYPITNLSVQRLQAWLHEKPAFPENSHWKWLRYLLPAIAIIICIGTMADWFPMNVFYLALVVFGSIAFQLNKKIAPVHEQLSKMAAQLETLSVSIRSIEQESFQSPLLKSLQADFISGDKKASASIRSLHKTLDRLDLRYNMVLSVPLDLVLFWSLQQVLALEQWKKQESGRVEIWLARLAEMESLNSISTIHFNQPDWVFPELKENYFSLEARSLGHPLINEKKRVNNDISIKDKGELMLITGSNMAGKSTFLRSTGVNLVLAMAGAPVCATYFSFTPVQLISSMRIADNLEESTSTFYAELKKLKSIIDRVNAGEKLFIVLDEILRGTNSHDRHTGSDALIRQLIRHQAAGMIATHDLALADIQQSFPQNILNHHFDVQVSGEELYFDYKLKPGVCQSMNASILMRKIGIENI